MMRMFRKRGPRLTNAKRLVGSTSGYQVSEGVPVDGADAMFNSLVRSVQKRKFLVVGDQKQWQ